MEPKRRHRPASIAFAASASALGRSGSEVDERPLRTAPGSSGGPGATAGAPRRPPASHRSRTISDRNVRTDGPPSAWVASFRALHGDEYALLTGALHLEVRCPPAVTLCPGQLHPAAGALLTPQSRNPLPWLQTPLQWTARSSPKLPRIVTTAPLATALVRPERPPPAPFPAHRGRMSWALPWPGPSGWRAGAQGASRVKPKKPP